MTSLRPLISAAVLLALAGCTTAPQQGTPASAARQNSTPHPKAAAPLAVLASNAGVQEKARACQELGDFGGPEAVPALAALLSHEQLADYARSGLEGIQHPSAGKALRDALPQLTGRNLAGVVNSLGVRREIAAVSDLQKLALDPKRGVAPEALAALGMIGTPDAAKTLQHVVTGGPAELRVAAAHAALTAATQLTKAGNAPVARGLLESVVRSAPPGHVATVAKNQADALRTASAGR